MGDRKATKEPGKKEREEIVLPEAGAVQQGLMGVDPEAAYTENTARGKKEWGQTPWAHPFFPPSNLPAGHPSGSTTRRPEGKGTQEMQVLVNQSTAGEQPGQSSDQDAPGGHNHVVAVFGGSPPDPARV